MARDPYDVIYSPAARRALSERLPESVAAAAFEFTSGPLAEDPHRVGAALKAPFEGDYRARRGGYRVRYRIDESRHRVDVLDIEHRRGG